MVLNRGHHRGDSARRNARGFSLIELLVCVSVVAVLIALALPAIGKVRSRAQSTACAVSLRSASTLITMFAEQANRGGYPNALEPGAMSATWTLGSTQTLTNETLEQTRMWAGPLAARGWVSQWLEGESYSCPVVARRLRGAIEVNPQMLPHESFWYSAALYTRAEMWDSRDGKKRELPDEWRKTVGMHEVLYPAQKAVLFEAAEYHGKGGPVRQGGGGQVSVNVGGCDGHVVMMDTRNSRPALAVPWPRYLGSINVSQYEGAMPFSASENGYAGIDW